MVDISKQVEYWKQSAQDDFEAAVQLIDGKKTRQGLFFAHLSLEKLLKAVICQRTQQLAPRIHNLVRLVEISGLNPPASMFDFLAEMNTFNLEGRYPVPFISPLTECQTREYIRQTQEAAQWLIQQL